jgi:hypothetical protein
MMLAMMDAMGILDRVPGNGLYGSNGYGSSPWNRYANPYSSALGWRGLNYGLTPGLTPGLGNSAFLRSPWGTSPWTQSLWSSTPYGAASPLWGSPDWGVLPIDRYSYNRYAPYGTSWTADDLSGWVNEPWETSTWNPDARDTVQRASPASGQSNVAQGQSQQPAQPVAPIVQNFTLGTAPVANAGNAGQRNDTPPSQPQNSQWQHNSYQQNPNARNSEAQNSQGQNRRSPLARLDHPSNYQRPLAPQPDQGQSNRQFSNKQHTNKQPGRRPYEKPCVTDFCGLKKPDLNGLWVAQDGEMLGIKNKRYLWSDGNSRYLTGRLKIENEYLVATVENIGDTAVNSDRLMRFKYKLAGDNMLTLQPDGTIREFVRVSVNQYPGTYPTGPYLDSPYGQNYGTNY